MVVFCEGAQGKGAITASATPWASWALLMKALSEEFPYKWIAETTAEMTPVLGAMLNMASS